MLKGPERGPVKQTPCTQFVQISLDSLTVSYLCESLVDAGHTDPASGRSADFTWHMGCPCQWTFSCSLRILFSRKNSLQGPELHGLFMFDSHFGRLVLGQKLDIDLDIIDVALSRCIPLYSIVSRCILLYPVATFCCEASS